VVGAGQGVAVEDLDPVAVQQSRHLAAELFDDGGAASRVALDHLAHDVELDALELLVEALESDAEEVLVLGVDGAWRLVEAAGDEGHGRHDGGEEQFAGVLLDGQALEEVVQGLRLQGVFQQGASHHRQRSAGGETLEERVEQHGGPLALHGDNTRIAYSFASRPGLSSPRTQSNHRPNLAFFKT
jgi:hypothetical protein